MMTPEQMEKKQFTVRLRGYDVDEVDDYLDTLVGAYRDLLANYNRAKAQLDQSRNAPTMAIPPVIQDTVRLLNVAQQAHDQMVSEASADADRMRANAEKEAQEIVAAGHEKRHAMIGQLEERRQALEEHVTALQKTREAIMSSMKMALDSMGPPLQGS